MSSSSSGSGAGAAPAAADWGVHRPAADATSEAPPKAAEITPAVAQRVQHAQDFWLQLEAAAAAELGAQKAKETLAAFTRSHQQKIASYNLEQAEALAAQILAALSRD